LYFGWPSLVASSKCLADSPRALSATDLSINATSGGGPAAPSTEPE
jgi:hypothetical protein